MLPHNKKNILKENIKKILILKNNYNNIIKKSIFQNRILNNKTRICAFLLINKQKTNSIKLINTCLLTGRKKGINKFFHLSRHQINIISKTSNLQNFKINS